MPLFRIETNVKRADIVNLDAFTSEVSATLAKLLGKPEQYIQLIVVPDAIMIMGGNATPCASATLASIGGLGVDQNKAISGAVYPLIEKHLGVKGDRCYIIYVDKERADIGFNGTTFHKG